MSIWIEFRCSKRAETDACLSRRNAGPAELVHDPQRDVIAAFKDLAKEARATGWKKTADGWTCPHCAATV